MNRKELIEQTLIDLYSSKTPAKHKPELAKVNAEELSELVDLLITAFDDKAFEFILLQKDVHIPSIGNVKIKRGKKDILEIRELLNIKYGISDSSELDEQGQIDYEKEVNQLKIERIKVNQQIDNRLKAIPSGDTFKFKLKKYT